MDAVILTDRLIIREFVPEDIDALYEIYDACGQSVKKTQDSSSAGAGFLCLILTAAGRWRLAI